MVGMNSINGWAAGASTTALGLNEYYQGKKILKNNERPEYQIPEAEKQKLSMAQQMAAEGLPEQQKAEFLSNLQRSGAYGLSQSSSRKGGLTGIGQLNEQQNQGYQGLMAQDSAVKMQNEQGLMGALGEHANYQDQAFQLNKLNPYYEKQAQGLALKGAGMQNIGQSFQIAQGGGGGSKAPSGVDQSQNQPQNRSYGSGFQQNSNSPMNPDYKQYNPYSGYNAVEQPGTFSNQGQGYSPYNGFNPYSK